MNPNAIDSQLTLLMLNVWTGSKMASTHFDKEVWEEVLKSMITTFVVLKGCFPFKTRKSVLQFLLLLLLLLLLLFDAVRMRRAVYAAHPLSSGL